MILRLLSIQLAKKKSFLLSNSMGHEEKLSKGKDFRGTAKDELEEEIVALE